MRSARVDAVLAGDAQDAEGLVDLRGAGWNHLVVPELPYAAPRLALAVFAHLPREQLPGVHVVTVRLEDPARRSVPLRVSDQGAVDRVRATLNLQAPEVASALPEHTIPLALVFHDVPLRVQGVHRFVVAHGDEDLREVPFDVRALD